MGKRELTVQEAIETAYYDVQTAKLFLTDAQRLLEKFNLSELPGKSLNNALRNIEKGESLLLEKKEQNR